MELEQRGLALEGSGDVGSEEELDGVPEIFDDEGLGENGKAGISERGIGAGVDGVRGGEKNAGGEFRAILFQPAREGFVFVHQKHAGDGRGGGVGFGRMPRGADHDRKQDRKSGAARRRVADLDFAAVFFDDAVANAEAEAGSLPYGLGGVKGIEDAMGTFHAGAAVGEFNAEAIAGDDGANPDFAFAAIFADGVYGVIENIQKNLLELVEIAGREREAGIALTMDVDAVELHVVFAKDERFFENLVELDGRALGLVLASEAQKILDDVMGTLGLFMDLFEVIAGAGAQDFFGFKELAVAKDGGEGIVEFVGHAGN